MPVLGTQSSIAASAYGFLGSETRTVESSIAPRNLTEGTQITVTTTTSGIEDGTTLYYTIRGVLGTITAADFSDNSLTGTVTINNDSGSFTKTVASDGVIEEGEAFVIDIRADSHSGSLLETTDSVYIQGSTSTGVGQVDDGQGGSTFHDFGGDGNLVFDANTSTSYTYTAATNVKFRAYIWGQGGQGNGSGQGGYSYGTFNLSQGDVLHLRLNYGAGSAGSSSGWVGRANGGGLAGIFSSSTINQSNARLIAGGGGGAGYGHGTSPGGPGGGPSGSAGTNSSDTQIGSTGGGGGTQSSGGPGGSAGGSSGSALQGGTGGAGQTNGYPNAGGGGGGGGGYYGGGGGGGGNDNGSGTRNASGGGGGSGYVHSSVSNGFTGGFSNGQSNPNRGNAGEAGQNSKVVFEGITSFDYVSTGGNNESYSVNVPSNATSMTAKLWGAGGSETGEPSGSQSGGSGGHVEGTIPVTSGSTVNVYVGGTSSGSVTGGAEGSGAGLGGALSAVKYGSNVLVAGGGGGAGQNGNGGGGGANGAGLDGTGSRNGTGAGVGFAQSDLSNATARSATGGLTENPACINNISGWYTRTGNTETDAFTGIRTLVIKWDGATIGSFTDKEIVTIGTARGVIKNGHFYAPSTKAGNSAYGWCTDDSCGTCSSPSGDMCNSFDVIRYNIPSGAGPGQGGSSNDTPGGSGGAWNDGDNVRDGGTSGGSGVGTGNRGGGGGAGFFGGGGGGGDNNTQSGSGGGGGSGIISGSWTNTVSQQGQTGTSGGRTAVDNGDPDYVSGYGGSGQNGLVVLIFE